MNNCTDIEILHRSVLHQCLPLPTFLQGGRWRRRKEEKIIEQIKQQLSHWPHCQPTLHCCTHTPASHSQIPGTARLCLPYSTFNAFLGNTQQNRVSIATKQQRSCVLHNFLATIAQRKKADLSSNIIWTSLKMGSLFNSLFNSSKPRKLQVSFSYIFPVLLYMLSTKKT